MRPRKSRHYSSATAWFYGQPGFHCRPDYAADLAEIERERAADRVPTPRRTALLNALVTRKIETSGCARVALLARAIDELALDEWRVEITEADEAAVRRLYLEAL